jgi:hypothetical protein
MKKFDKILDKMFYINEHNLVDFKPGTKGFMVGFSIAAIIATVLNVF